MAEQAPKSEGLSEFEKMLVEKADVVVDDTGFPEGALPASEILATRDWFEERQHHLAANEQE